MMKRRNFSKKLKKRVFKEENQIDAGLSFSRYLLCNCRQHLQQYIIHSLQNSYKREKCQNPSRDQLWSRRSFYWSKNFAKNFEQKKLDHPLTAKNVDGTINKKGTIQNYVDLEFKIDLRNFKEQLYVTGLGKQKIILGFPWLQKT